MTTVNLLKVVAQLASRMREKVRNDRHPTGNAPPASRPAATTQRGEQHESERSSTQQFLPLRTPGGIS
ncbi:MAG TPA: hypothetical protein VJO32_02955 [Ktedonobacteraceae bacterium]|nr:hypothetical protein [Ktedonobacteraceae bacterium]